MKTEITCPGCGTKNSVTSSKALLRGGTELDGRPLAATPAVVATWRWTCASCGLVSRTLESARRMLAAGDLESAAREALAAAWIEEDLGSTSASECRSAAAWLLRRSGQDVFACDLLRRNGDHSVAAGLARRVLEQAADPRIRFLAQHQLALTNVGDESRQSMVDLFCKQASLVS
jgi:hypothetical protein